ncbi:hypothetical protein HYU50_01140 [Candidatus Woesearchaeota archaeon]|nr:hypothetical protein [Candidatus Woesearchaeota archaeon]
MEEKKDDDDISIDLSKITGFFKRRKEDERKHDVHAGMEDKAIEAKQEEQKTEDEEISIDFSRIRNIFKAKKTEAHEDKKREEYKAEKVHAEEKKDDDEITIDFSKIKSIFGAKPKHDEEKEQKHHERKTEHHAEAKKEDDEVSLDFSKIKNIKNIFRKDEKAAADEDIAIDIKKIKDFFVRHRILLLLLIPIFLSIFLRVQPAYLPITDKWAADTVINSIKSQISGQISQQYPNLPEQNRNALVENELQKVLRQQKSQIDQQIKATSNAFKSRLQDDSGQTYLSSIDPFYWMRHTQNVLKNGHPGDEIRDGKPWDNHMLAPGGRPVPFDMFHAYFQAYLFKFLSFFNRDIGLMKVAFYMPVLISALAVIPAFFITRKIAGDFGGFIAATIVAIHPSFLIRTMGGISDTDAYNVVFPLLITWIFLEALEAKSIKNSIILSAISGLLVGLFSFAWSGGWWYIFDFILASTVLYIAYYTFVHKNDLIRNFSGFVRQRTIKNSVGFLLIFCIVSALSVTLFVNFSQFTGFAKNPMGFARLKEVGITTIWPNVFTTVAEQNPASLNSVIEQIGFGKTFFFLIALMGIALTVTRINDKKWWFIAGTLVWYVAIFFINVQNLNIFLLLISIPIIIRILIALWESDTIIDIKYAILLVLWFVATTFASTKGVRFTLLLVPAFSIGFGVALGQFYRYAATLISKGLSVNKMVSKTALAILLILLIIPPYISARDTAKNSVTDFDDSWRVSLEKIKEDSKPDAIVNSWWDFGHWFKFWTDRAVTFDGTSQNTDQAHWIGKVLLTDNEDLAIGILRMLDCSGYAGGTRAFDALVGLTGDEIKAIDFMYRIMPESREEAENILLREFNKNQTENVLKLTHCQAPQDYFITSGDMVAKSGVWAHFGSWDFDRALIYNTLKKKEYANNLDKSSKFLQDRFNYSKGDAENIYYEVQSITTSDQANGWIAPWPGYAGTAGCSANNDILTCSNGFIVNLTDKEVFANAEQGVVHPKKASFPTNDGIALMEFNESLVKLQNGRELGFALIKKGDSYGVVQMDSDLVTSMFTRLFYQDGIGLRHFKKFSDEVSIFGSRIIVWKVDWEGKEKNIIEAPEEEAVPEKVTEESNKETVNGVKVSNTSENTL